MAENPEDVKGMAAIKELITGLVSDMRNPNHTPKEKALGIIVIPICVPVTIFLIILGFEKEDAFIKGVIAAMLVYGAIAIRLVMEFGPDLLAEANSVVNG